MATSADGVNPLEVKMYNEIRAKKRSLIIFKRKNPPPAPEAEKEEFDKYNSVIDGMQAEVDEIMRKFNAILDKVYADSNEDHAFDFFDELFYELDRADRTLLGLGRFYDTEATQVILGGRTFKTKEDIIQSIMDKFDGLKLRHRIVSIKCDPYPRHGVSLHAECTCSIQVEEDAPRKCLYIMDLTKSSIPSTYEFTVLKELFLVQDARPLYHLPEKAVPKTNHDNWEPQFKPKEPTPPPTPPPEAVEEPAVVAAEGKDAIGGEADKEGEDDDGEEEEEEEEEEEDGLPVEGEIAEELQDGEEEEEEEEGVGAGDQGDMPLEEIE